MLGFKTVSEWKKMMLIRLNTQLTKKIKSKLVTHSIQKLEQQICLSNSVLGV